MCDDFSMVDMTLLQQALKSAVICKHCQNNKSEMKLYKDDNKRHGLAETFYLQCSECLNETKFFFQVRKVHREDLRSIADLFWPAMH